MKAWKQTWKVFLHVEMCFMFMIWWILYRKRLQLPDGMHPCMVRRKENAGESYKDAREILLVPEAGVRYTVPSVIRIEHMAKELTVRFRVGGVYKNCYISCYLGKERIIHRKRPVVAPGEMEQIKLTKEQLLGYPYADKITLKIEEA